MPVTSGGKKRTMRDMKGAMSMPKEPAAMVAPKIPVMPRRASRPSPPCCRRRRSWRHHNRHADAHRADAQRLDQGGDAGDQQVGVDQEGDFLAREAGRLADDQRHGDGATVHQQHAGSPPAAAASEAGAGLRASRGCGDQLPRTCNTSGVLLLSVAGGHRKRQVPAAGYFWPNIHPRLQGDAVGCFISPLCARFNRFFVYKVFFL